MPAGEVVYFDESLSGEILGRGEYGVRTIRLNCHGDLFEALERAGHVPLPPYIHRPDTPADRQRYQTVFARAIGSVAAPTAGLHFTEELLAECRSAGADVAYITLHVGLGTFQPLHTEIIEQAALHSEVFRVTEENASKLRDAKRLVAVGTTSVRTIETLAQNGSINPSAGETGVFIYPGFEFRATGAMLTNFHLPRSSLLLLVCAFGERDLILAAYRHAVEKQYRFYSYGDCMLVI